VLEKPADSLKQHSTQCGVLDICYKCTNFLQRPLQREGNLLIWLPQREFNNLFKVKRLAACVQERKTLSVLNGVDEVQKQLVLCNLKEAYIQFKETHPDIAISFSTFSELRPKWCVLAGAYATHTTCVCTIYHNMKL
jgi:hypothetical protein